MTRALQQPAGALAVATKCRQPTCTEPMYPTPSHLSEARTRFASLPSLRGERLYWPDGRVTDLKGFPLRKGEIA